MPAKNVSWIGENTTDCDWIRVNFYHRDVHLYYFQEKKHKLNKQLDVSY